MSILNQSAMNAAIARGIDAPVSFPRDRRCLPRYLRGPACRCDHSSTPL